MWDLKNIDFLALFPFPSIFDKKGTPFKYAEPLLPLCFLIHISKTGLLIFRRKKGKISRDFQGQIRRKIGRFRGIFAGKKSKFAEQSADFGRFSREKSQNSQKNQPISRDFGGKKSVFEGFSGANS